MNTGAKVLIAGGITGGLAAIIYALTRTSTTSAAPGNNVDVYFTPVAPRYAGRYAALFGPNSPVLEGQQTVMTATITNTSTQLGVAVAAVLTIKYYVTTTDGTVVLALQTKTASLAAGGQVTYTATMTAPLAVNTISGHEGQSLGGYVNVYDPNENFINGNAATEAITSISVNLVIGANYLYYAALGSWITPVTGTTVPYGSIISLGLSWQNSSNITVTGTASVSIKQPDGTVITPGVASGQNQVGSINAMVTGVVFNSFTCNQVGAYTVTETVTYTDANGIVHTTTSTYTFTVAAAPIIYGATITIG
jgi:hypothetical protein